jgi:hypothetical protein
VLSEIRQRTQKNKHHMFLSRKDKVWSLELGGGQSEEHWLTGTKYSYIGGITSNIL